MQVIVSNSLAKYVFEDSPTVTKNIKSITTDCIDCPRIGDLNESNSTIYTGVQDVPADWCGDYYTYDGTTWAMSILHPSHKDFIDVKLVG